jgi:hypothetical protein
VDSSNAHARQISPREGLLKCQKCVTLRYTCVAFADKVMVSRRLQKNRGFGPFHDVIDATATCYAACAWRVWIACIID